MTQQPAPPDSARALAQFLHEGETALLYQGTDASLTIQGAAKNQTLSPAQCLQSMRQLLQPGDTLRVNLKSGEVEWLTNQSLATVATKAAPQAQGRSRTRRQRARQGHRRANGPVLKTVAACLVLPLLLAKALLFLCKRVLSLCFAVLMFAAKPVPFLVKAVPLLLVVCVFDSWNRRLDLFGLLGPALSVVNVNYQGPRVPSIRGFFFRDAFSGSPAGEHWPDSSPCGSCGGSGSKHVVYPGGIDSYQSCSACNGSGRLFE